DILPERDQSGPLRADLRRGKPHAAAQCRPADGLTVRLAGKVAIVTGGAQGIGLGIATAMAQAGARGVIGELPADKAQQAAGQAGRAGGEAVGLELDVTSRASVDAAVARTVERFGTVDILVNNAGVWKSLQRRPFWEVPEAEWDAVLAVNTRGP